MSTATVSNMLRTVYEQRAHYLTVLDEDAERADQSYAEAQNAFERASIETNSDLLAKVDYLLHLIHTDQDVDMVQNEIIEQIGHFLAREFTNNAEGLHHLGRDIPAGSKRTPDTLH